MASINELQALKDKVKTFEQESAKAIGALEQITKRLKEEFDCATLEEAEALVKRLQAKAIKYEQEFEKAMADFKAAHPEYA